jgi:hypothetical protein
MARPDFLLDHHVAGLHHLQSRRPPVSVAEKITHRVLTTTDGAASALGGEAGKLIVLGGQLLPILATMLYLAVLIVMASVSYLLIEQPGQEWARQAGWTKSTRTRYRLISRSNASLIMNSHEPILPQIWRTTPGWPSTHSSASRSHFAATAAAS